MKYCEILPFLHSPVAWGDLYLSTGKSAVSGMFSLNQALSVEVQVIFHGQEGALTIKQITIVRVAP
ncbi:MAG: hypothetical protein IAE83_13050 [Anaerolinea sp.]|nr:hypothetical protein [Anaerolinea sp.]MCC6972625.1 hypothetical protein [Anaerolineae bacterium]CAG0990531.1 hypothetical protein ANRL4_02441 [Anaerolineae bacterium]